MLLSLFQSSSFRTATNVKYLSQSPSTPIRQIQLHWRLRCDTVSSYKFELQLASHFCQCSCSAQFQIHAREQAEGILELQPNQRQAVIQIRPYVHKNDIVAAPANELASTSITGKQNDTLVLSHEHHVIGVGGHHVHVICNTCLWNITTKQPHFAVMILQATCSAVWQRDETFEWRHGHRSIRQPAVFPFARGHNWIMKLTSFVLNVYKMV